MLYTVFAFFAVALCLLCTSVRRIISLSLFLFNIDSDMLHFTIFFFFSVKMSKIEILFVFMKFARFSRNLQLVNTI